MYLKNYFAAEHSDWVDVLPLTLFWENTTSSLSLKISLFVLSHGFDAFKLTDLVLAKKDENSPSTYFLQDVAMWAYKREHI